MNQDSNSSLSFEEVKVMMECGMAHSLMHGISRIKLHHDQISICSSQQSEGAFADDAMLGDGFDKVLLNK